MEKIYALGIDIGGTNIRMGIVDNDYELTSYERRSSQDLLGENAIPSLIAAVKEYMARECQGRKISAISVGIPGAVSGNGSFVYSVPKLHGLEGKELGHLMSEALDNIPVFVGHDVIFLLKHDIVTMNLDPERNKSILGFYVGTGFGNAIYLNGQFHNGRHGVTGELGHIPLYGVEDVCDCGAVGCVETRCCGKALADLVKAEFPDVFIGDIFTKCGNDPRIIKFVKECAIPIATEITLLDPDYVLLGGGVISMPDFPIDMLKDEIRNRTRHPLPAEDLEFVLATDGQNNGVIGGAMTVLDQMA